uniref:Uncharacterized protein n=1 Tax=Arion vulgaris TaxID=1028688 RepID=A0A0B7A034_9EUPU
MNHILNISSPWFSSSLLCCMPPSRIVFFNGYSLKYNTHTQHRKKENYKDENVQYADALLKKSSVFKAIVLQFLHIFFR